MLRIAIVEDEILYTDTIKEYIGRYCVDNQVSYQLDFFQDGDEITKDYKGKYDIIFLDIEMKFLNGFETAKWIRTVDKEVIIIFITNSVHYAVKGYSVDALSYLVKPVPYFAFSEEMKKSMDRISKRKIGHIMLSNKGGFVKINIRDIIYIETFKHNLIFHTREIEYSMVGTMKEIEKTLEGYPFYRCNSGYMVNLEYVTGVVDNQAIVGKYCLSISRGKRRGFLEAITAYIGG